MAIFLNCSILFFFFISYTKFEILEEANFIFLLHQNDFRKIL